VSAPATAVFPPRERPLDPAEVDRFVGAALAEDLGAGDRTSEAALEADATATAVLLLKKPGVVCGLDVAAATFRALDPAARVDLRAADGDRVDRVPFELARVEGNARALLAAERTALNLLGRLCGVATLTRSYVDAVAGTGAVVLDTRKTTPGLRLLEKHAVRCGGAVNHRFGLDDAILLKDNHRQLTVSLRDAVENARRTGLAVEVECETIDDVREALELGVDAILLDNMSLPMLREAVALVDGRADLEASGGVTLDTIREIADTGVGFVSVGALTHSARSLDVSMEVA